MVEVEITLKCDNCGKLAGFVGELHDNTPTNMMGILKPKAWYRFGSNDKSIWTSTDYMVYGDFCSLECSVAFINKAIEKKNNCSSRGRIDTDI